MLAVALLDAVDAEDWDRLDFSARGAGAMGLDTGMTVRSWRAVDVAFSVAISAAFCSTMGLYGKCTSLETMMLIWSMRAVSMMAVASVQIAEAAIADFNIHSVRVSSVWDHFSWASAICSATIVWMRRVILASIWEFMSRKAALSDRKVSTVVVSSLILAESEDSEELGETLPATWTDGGGDALPFA